MKYRSDFVTNSSSSSFIIATDKDLPYDYNKLFERVTEDNLMKIIKETSDCRWSSIFNGTSDTELKELGGFTDKQLDILSLASCGELERYHHLLRALRTSTVPLYHIFVDRDWLYRQWELDSFIQSSNVIEAEYDL